MSTLRCYQREPLAPALRLLEMRLWRKVGSLEILSSIVRMAGGELELRCQKHLQAAQRTGCKPPELHFGKFASQACVSPVRPSTGLILFISR
jgi:hypothetical protein